MAVCKSSLAADSSLLLAASAGLSPSSGVQLSLYLIGGSGELISSLYCCIIQAFSSSFLKSFFFALGHKGPSSKWSFEAALDWVESGSKRHPEPG